jgi:tetratricopeptide (TPR) repeat protein
LRATSCAFVIVCVLTLLCFLPDLKNSLLIWDDSGYIYENPHIRSLSIETLRWAFGDFYLNYWAPLTWLSLALDYAVWGLDPIGYHLTNNILHALNAGVFFLICLELLKIRQPEFMQTDAKTSLVDIPLPLFCSVIAAIFFAIHPLRVESVAWATERKDVLSLFFGLPAILFYLWHTQATDSRSTELNQDGTWALSRNYLVSLAFFSLSLLSKSLMITLPVVLLVLDWFPLKRLKSAGSTTVLIEKMPFFLLSGAAAMLTINAQAKAIEQIDLYTRLLNAFKSIAAYVRLTVWPFDLSPFYVHPVNIQHITLEYALPVVFFIVVSLCCALLSRRHPIFMAAWLIYLITLLPFLGITQVGPQAMAGRFTYLAGLPLALLLSVGIMCVFARFAGSRVAIVSLGAAMILLLFVNGYLTVREMSFWRDDVTLWTRVIELGPNTGRAYFQRSHAYRLQGDYQRSLSDINEAIAIAVRKKYNAMHEIYQARAGVLLDMGDFAGAVTDYTKALETAAAGSRTVILYERGVAYQKSGRTDLANEDFRLSGVAGALR